MKKQPLISVLMPVRNASEFLPEAIQSIRKQTHTNWELLCVDDGSTDGSYKILRQYQSIDRRIKIYHNGTKKGIGYSLNKALRHAQGDYIARMDADDISLSNRFTKQISLLKRSPGVVACGGQIAMIDPKGTIFAYKRFPTQSSKLHDMIMRMIPLQHPLLMAKAEVLKNYRYQTDVPTAEDVDMLFYLLSRGKLRNVGTVIYQYRKSDTSNGYHSVKKTFYITFANRFAAIKKYHYQPRIWGLCTSLIEYVVVSVLPSKVIVALFEAIRYEPPLWKRVSFRPIALRFIKPYSKATI